MKVSFLVTYYNQQDFVSQSLESILRQEMPCDYEILVGDDGSTDNTLEIVRQFQNKYPDKIKIFQMPREVGVKYNPIIRASANRMNLLKHAIGDYLMFLDGDDFYCHYSFLADALAAFAENSKLVAYGFRFQELSPNGSLVPRKKRLRNSKIVDTEYLIRKYIPAGAFLFKNIIDDAKIAKFEKLGYFDDVIITVWFSQFGLVYLNTEKIIYVYRTNGESIINSMDNLERKLWECIILKLLLQLMPKFRKILFRKHVKNVGFLYWNRKSMDETQFVELIEKYQIEFNKDNDYDKFLCKLLQYNKISFYEKIQAKIYWLFVMKEIWRIDRFVRYKIRAAQLKNSAK